MTTLSINWKKTLLAKRDAYMREKYQACKDFGTPLPKPYNPRTTNGLTRCVCDWLLYHGHYSSRINSTGRVRLEKVEYFGGNVLEKARFIPSATHAGIADIAAIINGRAISIEIKNEATNDRLSPAQAKERARIEAAGGVYLVVTGMEMFVDWYNGFTGTC